MTKLMIRKMYEKTRQSKPYSGLNLGHTCPAGFNKPELQNEFSLQWLSTHGFTEEPPTTHTHMHAHTNTHARTHSKTFAHSEPPQVPGKKCAPRLWLEESHETSLRKKLKLYFESMFFMCMKIVSEEFCVISITCRN